MISERARLKIFGLALESKIEMGDAIQILKDIQYDDLNLAILTFKKKWEGVAQILFNVGSWVTRWEALKLIDALMKHYGINNREIWEEVLHTDLTLHMWDHLALENRLPEERNEADAIRLLEIDRITTIRAIIETYMVDTRGLQDQLTTKRNVIVFRKEMGSAIKKIINYRIKTDAAEFKKLLKLEFQNLTSERLSDFDKLYAKYLDSYEPLEVRLPLPKKESIASIEARLKKAEIEGVPADDSDENIDLMFEEIQLPDFNTQDATDLVDNDKFFVLEFKPKSYEVNTEGIIDVLKSLIAEYGVGEIDMRSLEELKTFQKHALEHDLLGQYWKIINEVEKKLLKVWRREIQTDEMKKLGKIITSVSIYKISLGNNTALLEHLKKRDPKNK
ncbi:MAG: hypothetical protein WC460_01765 [Patescibacteria group bacterium]